MVEKTIKRSVKCSGEGLHTGRKVCVIFHPAPVGWGVVFLKKVNNKLIYIKADVKNVVSTDYATNIGSNGEMIGTVEHALAAIRGLGIDNVIIEVKGDELPVLDGSARPFVELLESAGICSTNRPKVKYLLKKSLIWGDFKRWIRAYPARGFKVDYIIDFSGTPIGKQAFFYIHSANEFKQKVAPARTFGFLNIVHEMQEKGLALGGSLDNAVVFDDSGVLNSGGLRFQDEPVRHKLLDFMGDLSLLGREVEGYFQVYCSGHAFNTSFVKYLLDNRHEFLDNVSPVPSKIGRGYVYERILATFN
ncbi:UDP-3-O-acyl-N-acetylglucosamine deacetylase [Desulfothermus sp.]